MTITTDDTAAGLELLEAGDCHDCGEAGAIPDPVLVALSELLEADDDSTGRVLAHIVTELALVRSEQERLAAMVVPMLEGGLALFEQLGPVVDQFSAGGLGGLLGALGRGA